MDFEKFLPEHLRKKEPAKEEGLAEFGPQEARNEEAAARKIAAGLDADLYTKKQEGNMLRVKDEKGQTVFFGKAEELESFLEWGLKAEKQ